MNYPLPIRVVAVLVLMSGPVSPPVSWAQVHDLAPRPGVLLLRGGNVLSGEILQVGDRFEVRLGEGAEASLAAERVERRCESLDDAYRWQRALLPPRASVAEHLKLGDWCLRYGLFNSAAQQLLEASRRDPADARLEHFEKRLRMLAHAPTTPPPSSPATHNSTPQPGEEADPGVAGPRAALQQRVELEQFMDQLPAGTVEQFTRTIQPLLLNSCSTAPCHGPNYTGDFQLLRTGAGRSVPRSFTLQNLQRAVAALNRARPEASPLLTKATTAHGGADQPAIADREVTQLKELADWAFHAVGASSPATPGSLPRLPTPSRARDHGSQGDSSPVPRPTGWPLQIQQASYTAPNDDAQTAVQPAAANPATAQPAVDPFDPETFNRRYRRRTPGQ